MVPWLGLHLANGVMGGAALVAETSPIAKAFQVGWVEDAPQQPGLCFLFLLHVVIAVLIPKGGVWSASTHNNIFV